MWVLVFLLLGVLGLAEMSAMLYFWGAIHGSAAAEWIGPGTAIARLSVLGFALGVIGALGFFGQVASGSRERWAIKTAALVAFLGMFALAAVLGIPV